MSNSVRPHRRQPTRLPRLWDSPGKNTGVGCHFLLQCMKGKNEREVTQSCPTPRDPMDCSLPGSYVHGIFQTRVLEWGAISLSSLTHLMYSSIPCIVHLRIPSYRSLLFSGTLHAVGCIFSFVPYFSLLFPPCMHACSVVSESL